METQDTSPVERPGHGGGWVAGLAGLSGRIGIQVGGKTAGVLQVEDGRAELVPEGAPVQASIICKDEEVMKKLLSGEGNAVVAALQGRASLEGDAIFALKVIRALRVGSPFTAQPGQGG